MDRNYVIVCNEHKGLFGGCLLFWGHRTPDVEKRSFGGYTSDLTKCERYTREELENSNYPFTFYNGEDEISFCHMEDVCIKIEDLLQFDWLKGAFVLYRP